MSKPFQDPGELIFFAQDEYGELRVFDDGQTRLLSFGPGDEQSACLKSDPGLLLFEYTQAMFLAVLLTPPKKALCLGLGAGSLATALHRHCKGLKLTVVELRQTVIEIAQRYFYLPQGKRLRLHCGDAAEFMAQATEHYDLIFADLYTQLGMAPAQMQADFLAHCTRCLKPGGWLVLNCWEADWEQVDFLVPLEARFAEIWYLETHDGNWIVFASQTALSGGPQALQTAASDWSRRLGFPLRKHLKALRAHSML